MTPTSTPVNGTQPRHVRVGILGAGFGGLGMAIRLQQRGDTDFLVFERAADVGGTWWANTYPGCQCDIPSHLYSFSFAPNPNWTRTYPKQPELRDYLRATAEKFGIYDKVRLNTAVTAARWDADASLWRIETTNGGYTADVVVAAPGPLSEPSLPDLPGLDSFAGTVFHTATWNHDHDLRGRRVAVVGTGASAIQAVPEIAQQAGHLDVVQRTPPWVVPHRDRPITRVERFLYKNFPPLQRAVRAGVYLSRELLVPGLVYRPKLLKVAEKVARKHIADQVPDPELRAKVTPSYTIGCKRILPSNKWYPALGRENVELVTDDIVEIRPEGYVTTDGTLHEVDTIIFATGFYVTDIPLANIVYGVDGEQLAGVWHRSPQAYRGTAMAGFPNLFLLVGPNVGLGHNSIVFMIEAQLNYVLGALEAMRERGAGRVEVRADAVAAYNDRLQAKMGNTVWSSGGCASWYIDANGKNTTIWPDFTFAFWNQTRAFDPAAYELAPVAAGAGATAPGTLRA
ncbi:Baeyer-Villiger monooxygenase [Baekduia alba]|uniref:flavin-containing monooxygenase n=1 Tax=Baekduia alba TaxID=2997333 RepID=UPI002341FA23|nr:NAD(P)/FAD-dependent oxidoreductase [Baekduia alba]WCB94051.1 Baeyer-Villiger monooxygenase [Baekduia alba]